MDRGAWRATVHGVPKSRTRLRHTHTHTFIRALPDSLIAQLVKNLPAMQETQVQSLGWKAPLQKEMAIYSNILE